MSGRDKFKRIKPIIKIWVLLFSFFGKNINSLLFSIFRNFPTKLGILIRYILLKNLAKKVGDNVAIQQNVFLFNPQNIEIGNNVSIHPMCYIEGAGNIKIGNNVSIAHATTLISTNHTWENFDLPIKYNKETFGEIILEDDIWIGCGVRILSGVHLKSRSVVAAGAVVNKSFNSNSLIGGIPAKLIKRINEN